MKLAITLIFLSAAFAHGDNRKIEPPPDKLAAAAAEAFAKAKAANDKGDLEEAERLYRKALAIAPHPSTQYNLADVQRRQKRIQGAIDAYKKYLEMDPAAADRKVVEKIIVELEALPGTIVIDVEESDALVFIDGEPLQRGKDPKNAFVIEKPVGDHVVDVITAISHDTETCRSYHASRRECRLRPKPRADGNVVISGPSGMYRASMGRSGEPTIRLKGRFSLEPGKHQIYVTSTRDRQCKPLEVTVAKGDSVVTYVWAEVPKKWPDKTGPGGKLECLEIPYKQRVLRF